MHKTLLISTGGTIAGIIAADRKSKKYKIKDSKAFGELVEPIIQQIKAELSVDVVIDTYEHLEKDSSNITPEDWQGLVTVIVENYDQYDSFIITHGTNTLGYTCAALSFAIANLAKPVILTGSQVPMQMLSSDGHNNLANALRIACWPGIKLMGVIAVFGSQIIAGTRVKKETEFDFDSFRSFNSPSLGRIGRILDFDRLQIETHSAYMEMHIRGPATNKNNLDVFNKFDPKILSITEYPGLDTNVLARIVMDNRIKGVIIGAFGAGDMSIAHLETLKRFKAAEIPVVMGTQAPRGNANMQVNDPGNIIRDAGLAIPAYDMSIEAQTTKLMWLLSKKNEGLINYQQLCEEMLRNIRGEIRVIHEQNFGYY